MEQLGPYPMEKLKRVEKPTTLITDNIERFDEREQGFNRAARGDLGPVVQRERTRPPKYPLLMATQGMTFYLAARVSGDVNPSKAPIPEDPRILTRHIKKLGYYLRADIVGICNLPQYAVYSYDRKGEPVELNHKFAILIVVDQNYETFNASAGYDWISSSQSYLSYSTAAFIASMMAHYIRKLGYPARSHQNGNYQVVVPCLLLLSGIGEMSRMGNSVVNPFLGPRFKAAVVTTDLPLIPDKPIDFGLQEFCRICTKCADLCPSQAISKGGKVIYNGYECWKLDADRCTKFRVANPDGSGCGHCIKVCPWNKPRGWAHDTVRRLVKHVPAVDRLIVKMDDVWGYGKPHPDKQWWFDLEEIDGVMQIPKKRVVSSS